MVRVHTSEPVYRHTYPLQKKEKKKKKEILQPYIEYVIGSKKKKKKRDIQKLQQPPCKQVGQREKSNARRQNWAVRLQSIL